MPCIIRWPGHVPAGKVENGIISGLDWFPTLLAAAGNPNITAELLSGKKLGDQTFKVQVQQVVGKLAQTAIDFPPMQPGASFNLEAVKAQIQKAMAAKSGD